MYSADCCQKSISTIRHIHVDEVPLRAEFRPSNVLNGLSDAEHTQCVEQWLQSVKTAKDGLPARLQKSASTAAAANDWLQLRRSAVASPASSQ